MAWTTTREGRVACRLLSTDGFSSPRAVGGPWNEERRGPVWCLTAAGLWCGTSEAKSFILQTVAEVGGTNSYRLMLDK